MLAAASLAFASTPTARKKPAAAPQLSPTAQAFLRQQCLACHSKASPSGGLDLGAPFQPTNPESFKEWVKVVDRVAAGEMPPKTAPQPTPAARSKFLAAVTQPLLAVDAARVQREGRSTWRRMNRYEYENTLRDLLGAPWLQVKDMLPEDGLQARFNKVGDALDVSHVQMSRYLSAASYALHEALQPGTKPETTTRRYYVREQRSFRYRPDQGPERQTFPILENAADLSAFRQGTITVGASDPVKREQEAVGVVAGAYEPLMPKFDQFRAPVSGRYKLRLRAHSFWSHPESPARWWHPSLKELSAGRTHEPVSLYASSPQGVTSQLRKLGTLDFGPDPTVGEVEAIVNKGESIMPDAARLFRSRPPNWHNPLATPEGQPGMAFNWLEVEGPLMDGWPTAGQKLLAGDLELKDQLFGKVEIVPKDANKDAERLITAFVRRALRRPAQPGDIQAFVGLFQTAQGAGADFTESLLTAYNGVLCSPAFITLEERPGPLDDHALASRLSYFLWNSEPDADLRKAADQGTLHDPKVLAAQTDRMLADPRSRRFVDAFLDYWLDLRKTADTSPDETLYPDYYLDD